ncbi:MAG: penicillin-binding transpeptidase domain-containing protein, partial [Verrucomicrobiota bacterium]
LRPNARHIQRLAMVEEHPDYNHQTLADYKIAKAEFKKMAMPDQRFPAPEYLQGALLMIDNRTGAIIAQVGGRDFRDSMFDRITQGQRPHGTAFTPFVYAAAFEAGKFPATLLDDTPMDARKIMIGGTTGILGEWGPESFENVYENRITARHALITSKNAATVRMGNLVGTDAVVALAERAGLDFEGDLKEYSATFLGRNPTSPESLALAYTVFPNGGRRPAETQIIETIRSSTGAELYRPEATLVRDPAIDPYTAYQINSILTEAMKAKGPGPGSKARDRYELGDFPVAGKSGTEYNFTDNWFVGYTSEVTCLVWTGFDQTATIYPGAFSSDTVLPVWSAVMNLAAEKFEPKAFVPPPDALQVEICLKSGQLATDDCYEVQQNDDGTTSQVRSTYMEYLRPNSQLDEICEVHGHGGLRRITNQPDPGGPLRAAPIVDLTNEPVLPIGNTIVGTEDPYRTKVPLLRARVATAAASSTAIIATPLVAQPLGQEEGGAEAVGGAEGDDPVALEDQPAQARPIRATPIVAQPVIVEEPAIERPEERVQLPPPAAIDFDE